MRRGLLGLGVVVLACASAFACSPARAADTPAEAVDYGQPLTMEASIAPQATGTMTFSRDGKVVCSAVQLVDGTARCTVNGLAVGVYTFDVSYSGDDSFQPSKGSITAAVVKVHPDKFKAQPVSPVSPSFGQSATVSAAGLPDDATGTVTFTDGADTLCKGAVSKGAAQCSTTALPSGETSVLATYSGDADYEAASDAVNVTVARIATTFTLHAAAAPTLGHPRTYTLLASGFPADAGGVVAFFVNGNASAVCSQLVGNGAASCQTILQHTGRADVVAKYQGDLNYAPADASDTVVVPKSESTTKLVSPTSSSDGPVSFAAYVSSADLDVPALTGVVQFTVGGVLACSAPIVRGGAQCKGDQGKGGTVEARYGGNADVLPSHAAGIDLTSTKTPVRTSTSRGTAPPPTAPTSPQAVRYDPAAHARHAVGDMAAAFALLAVAGAGAAGAAAGVGGNHRGGTHERKSVSVGSAKVKHHKASWSGSHWGDTSPTWQLAGWSAVDRWSKNVPVRVAAWSPLIARVGVDANYLRAMLGSLSLALPAAGLVLGIGVGIHNGGSALPPPEGLLFAMLVVGIFDAFAGYIAAIAFAVTVVAQGAIHGTDSIRLLLGVSVVFFAVPLIAGAARPLRRPFHVDFAWWTRPGDLLISSLFGGWAAMKLVGTLPGLAHRELAIANHEQRIAIVVMLLIALRWTLETLCAYFYPERLGSVTAEKIPRPSMFQQFVSLEVKSVVFAFVAYAYLGNVWELWAGTAIFVIPQAIAIYEHGVPNVEKLYVFLPGGVLKTVTMMFVGYYFFQFFHAHVSDKHLLDYGFVVLALPSAVVSSAEVFGRDGPERRDSIVHQAIGLALIVIGVLFVLGKLP